MSHHYDDSRPADENIARAIYVQEISKSLDDHLVDASPSEDIALALEECAEVLRGGDK